ncbi:MAG TPA: LuxR family transcriptional regulator, partial [Anaerolineae bacterium]|nr:LuxR family transcriptional regulator [Anaerolineae bacterium]
MARLFAMNERRLSVVVLALFSAWLLAFPFEGQILHALAGSVGAEANQLALAAIAANGAGLLSSGFLVKSHRAARRLMLCAIACGLAASAVFFFPLSFLWVVALLVSSCSMGACLAAWGYYFQSGTPPNERINTAADGIVWANILMIGLNMAAIHLSPYAGLGLSMSMLAAAFLLALRLPAHDSVAPPSSPMRAQAPLSVARPLAFLCLFVLIITVDSGLMYQVLNPAYAHHAWLTSWYWAVPYIVAILVMKGLPRQTNRAYILYVALAMIGFSFIAFMILDRSAASYLLVNTLMLGACGVYDLFWWSILGEMLELGKNPAR